MRPGLEMLEALVPVPTIGVVPYLNVRIDDEDSLSDVFSNTLEGNDLDIAVIRLPRISNFTDFNSFEIVLGSKVRYVSNVSQFKKLDLVIIPGTKNIIQ